MVLTSGKNPVIATEMNLQKLIMVVRPVLVGYAGWLVCSCSSAPTPAVVPAVAGAPLAPLSVAGKTLVLDHSRFEAAFLGMTEDVDVFSSTWQNSVGEWVPPERWQYGQQWSAMIPFDTNEASVDSGDGDKTTYAYHKISDTEAIITSSYYPSPDEVYPNGIMRLKFVSPTEAQAQYISGGADDKYFFRNVRVIVK